MLLIALFCQLAVDVNAEPQASLAGAIVIQETTPHGIFQRYLRPESPWNAAAAEEAIARDPLLRELWEKPVATINGKVITGQDVLYRQTESVLSERTRNTPEQFTEAWRELIESRLPRAARQMALWTAVERECPPELLEEFRRRHERTWKEYARSEARAMEAKQFPESWKPHWIRFYVIQDYLDLKFGSSPPPDATSAWKEQVREFRQDAWKRAKVETAYVLREPLDKPSPGQVARPVSR